MRITELEAENKQLREQLVQMRTILDGLSEGVVASNTAGEFLIFNVTAENMVGIGETDNPPDEWSDRYGVFYPDTITPFPSDNLPLVHAIRGKVTNGVELFVRNAKKPEGVFITVSGRPLHDSSGELIGGVIVMRDITALKAMEAKLDESRANQQRQSRLLDTVFNSISDGVIVADDYGKYVFFNKRADEMGAKKLRGKHTKDAPRQIGLFQPDGESEFPVNKLPLALALLGENTDNIEMLLRNETQPEGIHVSISARPILNKKGHVVSAVAVIRDITQLKKTEERLKNSIAELERQTQLLESVFNNISDGIVVADKNGNLTMFNPRAEQIAGGPQLEVPINDWTQKYGMYYMDKETPFPTDELPLTRAIRGESTNNVEMFVQNPSIPDGAYLNVSGRPLRDDSGEQQGGVVVFHDVTDKVRAAEHLNQAFAQGRLEVVDTILHNIGNAINSVAVGTDTVYEMLASDKLSTRLAALANALEAHREDLGEYVTNHPQGQKVLPFIKALATDLHEVDADLKRRVERIRNRTNHIVDIIRTQKSHGDARDNRKDIHLAEALSSAINVLQHSIDKRGIEIEIDCEGAIDEIRIQESQFHQMIVNMVKNSIEAIDEIAKSGELDEMPFIRIRAHSDADSLRIDFTDNGIGIDPDQSRTIFTPGYTTKQKGTGLGLHSSANFVIAIGGKISASSGGHGKGMTIHVQLPCSRILPD